MMMPPQSQESGLPVAGGVLLIIGAIFGMIFGGLLVAGGSFTLFIPIVGEICLLWGTLSIIFSILALVGGIMAVQRKMWALALVGGILGIVAVGFVIGSILCLIGLILVGVSREQFGS